MYLMFKCFFPILNEDFEKVIKNEFSNSVSNMKIFGFFEYNSLVSYKF